MSLQVQPLTPAIGATVRITDEDAVRGGVLVQILQGLERFGVLLFPWLKHPLAWKQSDGRAVLAELLDWCTQERFTYRHRWQQGDLVIFHNPGMLHRSYPYSDAAQRVMHRTTLKGSEAIGAEHLQAAE